MAVFFGVSPEAQRVPPLLHSYLHTTHNLWIHLDSVGGVDESSCSGNPLLTAQGCSKHGGLQPHLGQKGTNHPWSLGDMWHCQWLCAPRADQNLQLQAQTQDDQLFNLLFLSIFVVKK